MASNGLAKRAGGGGEFGGGTKDLEGLVEEGGIVGREVRSFVLVRLRWIPWGLPRQSNLEM
jgi:hypothetical protein